MLVKRYKVIKSGLIEGPFNLQVTEGDEVLVSISLVANFVVNSCGILSFIGDEEADMTKLYIRIPKEKCSSSNTASMAELQRNKSMLYNRKKVISK